MAQNLVIFCKCSMCPLKYMYCAVVVAVFYLCQLGQDLFNSSMPLLIFCCLVLLVEEEMYINRNHGMILCFFIYPRSSVNFCFIHFWWYY